MREHPTHIGSRQKWFFPVENIKKDYAFLIINAGAPRLVWKVGPDEAMNPKKDVCQRCWMYEQREDISTRSTVL